MEGLISTFHIDTKIIIAQVVNFAIVFVVLYLFALKPLGKLMRKRREEIEQGLSNAKNSETELALAKEKAEEEIKKARREANEIITEAKQKADVLIAQAQEKAKDEADTIMTQAQAQIEKERAQAEKELQEKTAELVSLGVQKILAEDIDEQRNQSLTQRALHIFKQLS